MKKISREKLFPYTIKEDVANSISHGVGAFISMILLVFLVYKASKSDDVVTITSFAIFGYIMMLMFLMSCLYHGIRHYTTRDIFKRLDHSFIFLMILATYTPVVFVGLKTTLAYIIFALLCLVTIAGICFKVFFVDRFKILSTVLFIAMGWACVALIPQIIDTLNINFIIFIALGGVVYTIGAVIYAFAKFKYHHFIWHLFVMAAAFLQYYAIANYIL